MFSKFFNRLSLVVSAFALVFFISCKDEKSDKSASDSSDTPAQTINNTQNTNTNNSGDVSINPPHGQPGHSCDVPVGQPLPTGSTKSSPVINTTQSSPVINNSGSVPVNNNTTTGNVNPAHGQPGHRCEIPVGAPLD